MTKPLEIPELENWEFLYNKSTPLVGPSGYLRPYAIVRKSNKQKFTAGDDVLIESGNPDRPFVGKIMDFDYNAGGDSGGTPFVEMTTIWYSDLYDIPVTMRRPNHEDVSFFFCFYFCFCSSGLLQTC